MEPCCWLGTSKLTQRWLLCLTWIVLALRSTVRYVVGLTASDSSISEIEIFNHESRFMNASSTHLLPSMSRVHVLYAPLPPRAPVIQSLVFCGYWRSSAESRRVSLVRHSTQYYWLCQEGGRMGRREDRVLSSCKGLWWKSWVSTVERWADVEKIDLWELFWPWISGIKVPTLLPISKSPQIPGIVSLDIYTT